MKSTKNIVSIILARGDSKGIPQKNLINFCGKPLVAWTIEHAKKTHGISSVWVSSDSEEILSIAKEYEVNTILRPKNLAEDRSSAEDGFLHAIDIIEKKGDPVDVVVALQCTSPIRESKDIELALRKFEQDNLDSLFSASFIGDFFIWEKKDGTYQSINYDYKKRGRRQEFSNQYSENGSFYIFKPKVLRKFHNRLGGKIGMAEMEFWKMFEIDNPEDVKFCEIIMKNYLLNEHGL